MSRPKGIRGVLERSSTILIWAVPLVAIGVIVGTVGTPLILNIYTFFCVNLILVLGLQLFMGNSGILNWTYVGFVGIGAFAASIFSTSPSLKHMGVPNMYPALQAIQMPVLPALLLAGIVAAAVAAAIAWPLMRLSDAVGVITLFATLIVIHVVMNQWDNVTNGPRTFFGVQAFTTLWVALAGAVLAIVAAYVFRESGLGLRLRASRDDRFAAAAIGVNVVQVRYFGYVLSAFVAGIGGGVWAHFITSFSPKSFYISEAFLLVTMLVIGGQGGISGAVSGTAIVTLLREGLRQLETFVGSSNLVGRDVFGLTEVALAILMVVILVWRPIGIIGAHEVKWPFKRPLAPNEDADEG
jgi:branched-chain amino acid transport system permease protein